MQSVPSPIGVSRRGAVSTQKEDNHSGAACQGGQLTSGDVNLAEVLRVLQEHRSASEEAAERQLSQASSELRATVKEEVQRLLWLFVWQQPGVQQGDSSESLGHMGNAPSTDDGMNGTNSLPKLSVSLPQRAVRRRSIDTFGLSYRSVAPSRHGPTPVGGMQAQGTPTPTIIAPSPCEYCGSVSCGESTAACSQDTRCAARSDAEVAAAAATPSPHTLHVIAAPDSSRPILSRKESSPCSDTMRRIDSEARESKRWKMHLREGVKRHLHNSSRNGALQQILRSRRCAGTLSDKSVASSKGNSKCAATCRRISNSRAFHLLCGFLIIANSVAIGFQADTAVRVAFVQPTEEPPAWFAWVNLAFLVLFAMEVSIRIFGFGIDFICGADWRCMQRPKRFKRRTIEVSARKWNLFDVCLLLCSTLEELFEGINVTYFRLLRGFRMVRVLRVIRVLRFFRELRLMICSVIRSLVPLAWAIALLTVIMYLFAICLLHGVTSYLRNGENQFLKDQLASLYGSIGQAMFTLLLSISGGQDWIELAEPLSEISWLYEAIFAGFVIFTLIGLLNVLTSVFVERARELGRLDRDLVIQSEVAQNEAFIKEMKEIFEEADTEGTGSLSWTRFREYLENPHVQAYFATHKLDTSEAHELFRLLDVESNDKVDIEEFVMGCMRLKGQAKSADLAILLRESKLLHRNLKSLSNKVTKQLGTVASILADTSFPSDSVIIPVASGRSATVPPNSIQAVDGPPHSSTSARNGWTPSPSSYRISEVAL